MSSIKPNFNLQDDYTANWAITHAMELVPNTTQRMADAFAKLTAEWIVSGRGLESFTLAIMEHRFHNNIQYKREKAKKAAVYLSTKVFV